MCVCPHLTGVTRAHVSNLRETIVNKRSAIRDAMPFPSVPTYSFKCNFASSRTRGIPPFVSNPPAHIFLIRVRDSFARSRVLRSARALMGNVRGVKRTEEIRQSNIHPSRAPRLTVVMISCLCEKC